MLTFLLGLTVGAGATVLALSLAMAANDHDEDTVGASTPHGSSRTGSPRTSHPRRPDAEGDEAVTEDVSWVLTRYVPNSDPIAFSPDRTFLAPDLVTWVRRFAGAWQASLDEVGRVVNRRASRRLRNGHGHPRHRHMWRVLRTSHEVTVLGVDERRSE